MKKLLLTFIVMLTAVCHTAYASTQDGNLRKRYNFNPEWKLFVGDPQGAEQSGFNDTSWKQVTLPHAFNEDDAFKLAINQLSTGIVWYRKHFRIPARDLGKKVFIEFEGIRQGGEIFLNGEKLGLHENGVMAFGFDITDKVKFDGENVIALRIDNSWRYQERATGTGFQWNHTSFNANYGGIPKNVILHVTGSLYQTFPLYSFLQTTGVYIYAGNFDIEGRSATITAESEVKNDDSSPRSFGYEVRIFDMKGKQVKQFSAPAVTLQPGETLVVKAAGEVSGLNFWSWGYGYLYTVETALTENGKVVDKVSTRTGFRKTAFKNGMFYLNNRVLQIKGYAQRTSNEWPAIGMSVPPWISDFSNRMMVESNGNTVRWMHITPWKQDVESADRVGLIQMMPAGDSEKDVTGRQWEQRVEVMRDAIIYNRNNPSIIFYESGNEAISETHMSEIVALRNRFDPHGGRAAGSREMLDSKVAEYGGEMLYINKSAGKPLFATEYSRDEGLRKYWDEYTPPFHKDGDGPLYKEAPAREYNRNQDSHAIENVIRWFDYWRERPGTGKRVSSGGVNIVFSDSNTHFRGEENYRRSGEVDAMRLPKDGFWAHQVMWDGWVDLERFRTHIIGHWNYAPGTVKDIHVVSAGERVELFVNGVSKGMGEQKYRFLFSFREVAWEPGEIRAVSYSATGEKLSEALLRTAGKPAAVKLTLHTSPQGFAADGADVILVDVEVVDARGMRCPASNDMIHFTLSGPAEWRGGLAQGPDNFILAKSLPVECGVNRVMIRSLTQAGKVTVSASSEGLRSDQVSVTSKPVKVVDGLSEQFAGEALPSYTDRGPTPLTPSFKMTRTPVEIVSATAAVNGDAAQRSYDDNELSEWTNDGHIATGSITYRLEREATISEVCLKLSGWRMRQYPIQILVGNRVVFEGTTERSLGYVTIPVTPAKGKEVTIRLTGANTEKDAYNAIVELSGNIELDLFRDPNAGKLEGQLRIVEAEFYEAEVRPNRADKPLYRDPVFDGAADPVVIYNRAEKRWFMFYTNRRANTNLPGGVEWVHGTRIGIAESVDGGATWRYRDTCNIGFRPDADYTHWAPEVMEHRGIYHMYLTYVPGIFADWNHERYIVHLTSKNLIDWKFESRLTLSSSRCIDACVYQLPDGNWRMYYNNEADGKSIYYADSPDLYRWTDSGKKVVGDKAGEGPKVFYWKGKYRMLVDNWSGLGAYSSDDMVNWVRQPENLLEAPGLGIDDKAKGQHCDVVVSGDRAFVFYFTHPGREQDVNMSRQTASRRSSIQVAELFLEEDLLRCRRNEPLYLTLEAPKTNRKK